MENLRSFLFLWAGAWILVAWSQDFVCVPQSTPSQATTLVPAKWTYQHKHRLTNDLTTNDDTGGLGATEIAPQYFDYTHEKIIH